MPAIQAAILLHLHAAPGHGATLSDAAREQRRADQIVDRLIDGRPNTFDEDFRAALFAHTDGLPLFTHELLRELRAGGSVTVDAAGRWTSSPQLDWGRLPSRVEGIVAERIERLDEGLREILAVASTEGVTFSAQVVALGRNKYQVRIANKLFMRCPPLARFRWSKSSPLSVRRRVSLMRPSTPILRVPASLPRCWPSPNPLSSSRA